MGDFVTTVPQIGMLEWFRFNDREHAERTVARLKKLGIIELRTGISWADYYSEGGEEWYDWLQK